MSEEQPRRRRRRAARPAVDDAAETPQVDDAGETRAESDDVAADDAATSPVVAVPTVTVPTTGATGLLHRVKVDPAIGLGMFVPGLFVMALGGAATWHWIFNIGEGVMLLGMTYFVGAVIVTALQQRATRKAIASGAAVVTKRSAIPDGAAAAET